MAVALLTGRAMVNISLRPLARAYRSHTDHALDGGECCASRFGL